MVSAGSTAPLLPTDDVPVVSEAHCRVKLPKLVPKTFNDLTRWEAFWSMVQLDLNLTLACAVPVSINTRSACAQPGTRIFC